MHLWRYILRKTRKQRKMLLKKYSFLYYCRPRYVWNRIKDKFYYLKCLLWYRYNVVKVKTLPPTYVDRDYLLLHANFQILTDFLEKEKGNRPDFDYSDDMFNITEDEYHNQWVELCKKHDLDDMKMWVLYDWWHKVRPTEWQYLDVLRQKYIDGGRSDYSFVLKYEQDLWARDKQKLHELIDLYERMWT